MRPPEDAGLTRRLYGAYQARLRELGALDFDDLLTEALKLDTTGQRRFRHLLVDEFQDVNDVQYQLVRAWSRAGRTSSSSATRTSPSTASGARTAGAFTASKRMLPM